MSKGFTSGMGPSASAIENQRVRRGYAAYSLRPDLNRKPFPYHGSALPIELHKLFKFILFFFIKWTNAEGPKIQKKIGPEIVLLYRRNSKSDFNNPCFRRMRFNQTILGGMAERLKALVC